MSNPWIKTNPLLSMWLSSANSIAASMRSRAIAEGSRQTQNMMREGAEQMANYWASAEGKRQAENMTREGVKQIANFWSDVLTVRPSRNAKKLR